MSMQQRRIVQLAIQVIAFLVLGVAIFVFAGLRSVTFFVCTGWFTCGDSIFPSLSDSFAIIEWLQHWSIILMAVFLPIVVLLSIVVYSRADEMVMAGIRNAAILFAIQAAAAVVTGVTQALWSGPSLHFMTGALLMMITTGVVLWALFSPNQDFSLPIMRGALVVVSIIPVVPYISRFVT